jgi:hypothetical protein
MTTLPSTMQNAAVAVREGATVLAEAVGLERSLHLPGVRDRYRKLLEHAIAKAGRALDAAKNTEVIAEAQTILLRAHAARAEDARYGAGQLSRGSQRAPTPEDCDDGRLRVEEIVRNAEESARQTRRFAEALNTPGGLRYAKAAEAAAKSARQIVEECNMAYTFHTDPGFSFGEGWYLTAAALLAGVSIQIQPNTAHALQAERFLRDAGLGHCLVPYRPRPRSNKQLTAIVADAFRADPEAARRAVRAAFLGAEPPSSTLVEWTRHKVGGIASKKVLLWVRNCVHDPERNTDFEELAHLTSLVCRVGLVPIYFGDAVPDGFAKEGAVDMTLVWKGPLFQGPDMRRAQLQLFEELKRRHGLKGQLGVTTAGMDGPALTGMPTLYITQTSNVRMHRWVGVIPGYCEVVRKEGCLDTIEGTLRQWQQEESLPFKAGECDA